jgi:hypothetical protein
MKNKIITILVTALVTAAATCVTLSLIDSEPLTEWIKMARLRVKGCSNPEAYLKNIKRIRNDIGGMHQSVRVKIREGKVLLPEGRFSPSGHLITPTANEIFVLVFDFSDDGLDAYEFDLMKIMCNKDARQQIKELIVATKAQSSDFGPR